MNSKGKVLTSQTYNDIKCTIGDPVSDIDKLIFLDLLNKQADIALYQGLLRFEGLWREGVIQNLPLPTVILLERVDHGEFTVGGLFGPYRIFGKLGMANSVTVNI